MSIMNQFPSHSGIYSKVHELLIGMECGIDAYVYVVETEVSKSTQG